MKNFFLPLKYLIKSCDLLLNLLERAQQALLMNNHTKILGLNIEEDGDTTMEDTVGDTEADGEAEAVTMEDLGVVEEVMREDLGVAEEVIMEALGVDIMDITVTKDLLDLMGVLKEVMVVLMVEEEENGDIMQRNLRNRRCELLRKSR